MAICYLGIGSNLGDRRKNIRLAIKKIDALKGTAVIKTSRLIETEPQGGPPNQGKYLNAAVRIRTDLSPRSLLSQLKNIEKELGRTKTVRNGPRTIDLDILFFGEKVINRRDLKVPHLKVFEREFVVRPLLEVI